MAQIKKASPEEIAMLLQMVPAAKRKDALGALARMNRDLAIDLAEGATEAVDIVDAENGTEVGDDGDDGDDGDQS